MKSKEQRKEELKALLREGKDNTPLGEHKAPKKANNYKNPKNPHIPALKIIRDHVYNPKQVGTNKTKNAKRYFKKKFKWFKKRSRKNKDVSNMEEKMNEQYRQAVERD